jgi:hypothetical protein
VPVAQARDAKGAPLLTQHINSMDMQGADVSHRTVSSWIGTDGCA